MEKCEKIVGKATRFLDRIAGLALLAGMITVVLNVILRTIIGRPILGTYEYVGFATAVVIGLAIAHCAYLDSHIAVGFIMDKFPQKLSLKVDIIIHLVSFIFLSVSSWHMVRYAGSMIVTGEVSPTTKTPFYPFIYVAAFGLAVLSAVLLFNMIKIMLKVKNNG